MKIDSGNRARAKASESPKRGKTSVVAKKLESKAVTDK